MIFSWHAKLGWYGGIAAGIGLMNSIISGISQVQVQPDGEWARGGRVSCAGYAGYAQAVSKLAEG
jgi:hypothetical protein